MKITKPEICETLARAIHEEYVQHQMKSGKAPQTNPSMVPWDKLPEHLRESNRQQAEHIGIKLKAIGREIGQIKDKGKKLFEFTPEEIEKMAEMEHERWVNERLRDGWKLGAVKDTEKKLSPYLVPWNQLSEEVKGYDRNTVRGIPIFLAHAGLCIYQPKDWNKLDEAIGNDHLDIVTNLNDQAELLRSKGDYAGAEPLYRRALAIREKVLGKEHQDTARSLNNLAGLLYKKGDYTGAEPLYRRALAITGESGDDPDTAQSLNNLALLLDNKGDYERAEPLYRRVLAIREKVLGKEHPSRAISLNNLAALYQRKGDYHTAEQMYRQALNISSKILGKSHPDIANSLNNLAGLYEAMRDYENAEPLYREALDIRVKLLGHNHPDTAISLSNLAAMYRQKGDKNTAEQMYRRVLDILHKTLGKDHQYYKDTLNKLNELNMLKDKNNIK